MNASFDLLLPPGSTAQLRPWPPPQNPTEFLGSFSTIFDLYCHSQIFELCHFKDLLAVIKL
jgi:hypothetical protein